MEDEMDSKRKLVRFIATPEAYGTNTGTLYEVMKSSLGDYYWRFASESRCYSIGPCANYAEAIDIICKKQHSVYQGEV